MDVIADTSLLFNIYAKDHTGKTFDGMGKAAKLAFAGVALAAVGFGVKAVGAAVEDQKAQAILANTLKNSTGARASDVASVEDWVSKMTLATGVADDELRPALTAAFAVTDGPSLVAIATSNRDV